LNIAPADARTTFGLKASTVPLVSITALAPAASAERRIVPKLPGSEILSATTTQASPALFKSSMSCSFFSAIAITG
jgi:hypothetical protein